MKNIILNLIDSLKLTGCYLCQNSINSSKLSNKVKLYNCLRLYYLIIFDLIYFLQVLIYDLISFKNMFLPKFIWRLQKYYESVNKSIILSQKISTDYFINLYYPANSLYIPIALKCCLVPGIAFLINKYSLFIRSHECILSLRLC